MKNAIVLGAGISGLATAIRLQSKGYSVTLFEKNNFIGGKTSLISVGKTSFNLTATLPIMFDPYIDFFNEIGENIYDHLTFHKLDTFCKAFFLDGPSINFSTSLNRLSKELSLEDFEEYLNLLIKANKKYANLKKYFLKTSSKLNIRKVNGFFKINPLTSTYKYFSHNLNNKFLVKALSFQGMFIGMSPFESPNIFSLLPLVNSIEGLNTIEGGINSLVKAMHKIFLRRGGEIKLNSPVKTILFKDNICTGIKLENNKTYTSSLVVSSIDFPYTLKNLINTNLTKKQFPLDIFDEDELSCSTFILYLDLNKKFKTLETHNIFINKDFKLGIEAPFKGEIPISPHLYAFKEDTLKGCKLNLLLRVPNTLKLQKDYWTPLNISKIENLILENLQLFLKVRNLKSNIISKRSINPLTYKKLFNNYGAACYGLAPSLSNLDFFRPQCKIKDIENLYFVGDSVHPGSGVSSVLISSKIAVDEIVKDKN